jgi:hypothetical protein
MNLRSRISQIEAVAPVRTLEIHAVDEDDYSEKLLLSGIGAGPVHVIGTVTCEPIERNETLSTHEEYLELLYDKERA